MKNKSQSPLVWALAIVVILLASNRMPADTGTCGGAMTTLPFTDVAGNLFFCQIAEEFFSGLTNGTTSTTYSPSESVPREQMAAFITRTQDSAIRRSVKRAALGQWSTPTVLPLTGRTAVGSQPLMLASDGMDVWVADEASGDVKRVRSSYGSVIGTWTGASSAFGVLVARGRIFVTGRTSPGHLYRIDPTQPPGVVTTLSNTLGDNPTGIATDGTSIWTANGSTLSSVNPDVRTTTNYVGAGGPAGIIFDGNNLWVTDSSTSHLNKLGLSGGTLQVLQNVNIGSGPGHPAFDGSNIWVPCFNTESVSVVRVRDGQVIATLTGNGLSGPIQAAFDGQRVLVTNASGSSVSIWNGTDLTPIGNMPAGGSTGMFGARSDGVNFWIALTGISQIARL
jgi:hypothetical protein